MNTNDLPVRKKFQVFLLAGQSNMAGRGLLEEEDTIPHERVLTLNKDGDWVPAVDPIHFDKPNKGVCLGRTFGIDIAEQDPDITIGLIPAACGGSPISVWQPGMYFKATESHPYDDAISRTQRAMEDGVLKAILWHQGESDAREPDLAEIYESKLRRLIKRFRDDLNNPDLTFIIGQMGRFLSSEFDPDGLVNAAHMTIAKEDDNSAYVPSDSLGCLSDNVHFDAKALREFGLRYAQANTCLKSKA